MLPLYRAISVSGAVNRKMQTGNHQQVTEAAEEADSRGGSGQSPGLGGQTHSEVLVEHQPGLCVEMKNIIPGLRFTVRN